MNADEIVKALRRMAPQFQAPGQEVICGATDLIESLQAQLAESQRRERAAVEVVRCKDCRWKDTVLCRASKSVKYDLRREKHTYQTCMEPDGFCSIGERGPQEAGKGEAK